MRLLTPGRSPAGASVLKVALRLCIIDTIAHERRAADGAKCLCLHSQHIKIVHTAVKCIVLCAYIMNSYYSFIDLDLQLCCVYTFPCCAIALFVFLPGSHPERNRVMSFLSNQHTWHLRCYRLL